MTKTKNCCVNGCKNQNMGADSGVIFYKFPEAKPLRKKWVSACINNGAISDTNWAPGNETVICNVHFVSGQKNVNDWHPDYIPSVFRSLRRGPTKAKGKHLDDSDDESKVTKPKPSIKRTSLATPTRNTIKNRPNTTPSISVGSKKTNLGRPLSKKSRRVVLLKEESLLNVLNAKDDEVASFPQPAKSQEVVALDKNGLAKDNVKVTTSNKKKPLEDDSCEVIDAPVLKTLSVVLERTSAKKIKLSTGEITIKEEPITGSDRSLTSPTSAVAVSKKSQCKRCNVLQQRLKKLEASLKTAPGVDRCRQCPVLESKLNKMEDELDHVIDAKVSKCEKCSVMEQKCRKIENNLRKAQAEVNKFQSKITTIELNEETFKKYKNKVKMYTGFPNYEALSLVYEHLKSHLPVDAIKFLTPFQMFIIVLMRLKLNFPFWDLTYRFGASPNHIQSFYPQFIGVLEAQLSHVVLWPKANLHYRLEVLASNLKQSFGVIQKDVEVNTLLIPNNGELTEEDKTMRVCAALYHISQLVSSNHSQQLMRILKSKDDTDRSTLIQDKDNGIEMESESAPVPKENENGEESLVKDDEEKDLVNGADFEDVDDSDIFFEDFTKEIGSGVNSNESLKLECKNLRKELENLNQKLALQFKLYTGMRNFEVFKNLLGFLQSHVTHISNEKLSYFQQLNLVLIRLKLNLEVQDVSYLFNIDPDHAVYLTRLWVDVIVKKLSNYIDWPSGVDDFDAEKRLLGTVKLKYQILWSPNCAPRNKITGRQKEKFDSRQLLRACAALYNIDDIEVFKDGKKELKLFEEGKNYEGDSNEELEQRCRDLRSELYDLRKCSMSTIASCFSQENFENNDQMVQFYTGFPTYEMLLSIFNHIVPNQKSENRKSISPFQQFIILLLRLKVNISTQDLSFRFGMGHSNTHKFIQDWLILLHSQLAPHITWPDDDEDVEVFTDMLRKTYAYIRNNITPRRKDSGRKMDTGVYDIATLVCAGLYNIGEVSFGEKSESEFDSFDEEW